MSRAAFVYTDQLSRHVLRGDHPLKPERLRYTYELLDAFHAFQSPGSRLVRRFAMTTDEATVEVFWRAYEALKPADRRALAERILRDRKLLEDLADHVCIERSKRVAGQSITLDEYVAQNRKAGR